MMDRLKGSLFALFRASVPRLDYYAEYRGEVVAWNPDDQTVDVKPNDPRLPSMAGIPFRHGVPGMRVSMIVPPKTLVRIGFDNGDPSLPVAFGWSGGEQVSRLTLNASDIYLGGEAGAESASKGQTLQSYLDSMADLVANHIHVCTGGTVSPSAMLVAPAITPPDIKATNVKVK